MVVVSGQLAMPCAYGVRVFRNGQSRRSPFSIYGTCRIKPSGVAIAIESLFVYIERDNIGNAFRTGVRQTKGGDVLKSSYVNKDLEETRRLLTLVRQGGKQGKKARKKLEAKGIRYYTSEEAARLGIE